MGRLTQNTYCLSCGNCARSCPHGNVSWRARPPAREAMVSARPRWDEAWFMLLLLSLTLLHGLTMMPFWEAWVSGLGRILADSGRLLMSFSCLMIGAVAVPVAMYGLAVAAAGRLGSNRTSFRERFAQFAFASLPLTFSYHLAHNLNHLVRESDSFRAVLANPFGWGTLPASMAEQHARHMSMVIPEWMLFTLQGLLMMYGAWLAVKIVLRRSEGGRAEMVPILVFVFSVLGAGLWLLNQPMVMRF